MQHCMHHGVDENWHVCNHWQTVKKILILSPLSSYLKIVSWSSDAGIYIICQCPQNSESKGGVL